MGKRTDELKKAALLPAAVALLALAGSPEPAAADFDSERVDASAVFGADGGDGDCKDGDCKDGDCKDGDCKDDAEKGDGESS